MCETFLETFLTGLVIFLGCFTVLLLLAVTLLLGKMTWIVMKDK